MPTGVSWSRERVRNGPPVLPTFCQLTEHSLYRPTPLPLSRIAMDDRPNLPGWEQGSDGSRSLRGWWPRLICVARLLNIGLVAVTLPLAGAGCSSPGQRLPALVETSYVRMADEERQDDASADEQAPATACVDKTSIPSNPVITVAKQSEDPSQGLLVAPVSGSPDSTAEPPVDPSITQVSCPSCLSPISGSVSHLCSTCDSGQCVPGRAPYTPVEKHTLMGQILAEIVEIIANPDPCYQPGWIPEANAAFFVDFARPKTMVRLRADGGWDLVDPDRAEYFWARDDGKGSGPKFEGVTVHPSEPSHSHRSVPSKPHSPPERPPGIGGPGTGGDNGNPPERPPGLGKPSRPPHRHSHTAAPVPIRSWTGINYGQFSLYTEAASERGSLFVEIPYTAWSAFTGGGAGGFSDMNAGMKSVMFDSELFLLTFQFKTYIPTGNASAGLGTGHVSLKPSLLSTLKLTSDAYLQSQLAQWIPIGGNTEYQGGVLHYHFSLNQTLYRIAGDAALIGTFEFNGWSFQNGRYTDISGGSKPADASSYFSAGPGLRLALGPRFDCGVGTAFALTEQHWANQLLRCEMRFLY